MEEQIDGQMRKAQQTTRWSPADDGWKSLRDGRGSRNRPNAEVTRANRS